MFKFLKPKEIKMMSPITGKVMDISQVPDPVFAEKMVGDGVAIEPTDGLILSPCQGRVVQIFPTNHALGIETKEGFDLLIHLGIDTVALKGKGFERLIEEGQTVEVGTPLIKMDLNIIAAEAKSIISPVVITSMDKIKKIDKTKGPVKAGQDVMMQIQMK